MRLFFAIEVPDHVRAAVVAAQERLAAKLQPKAFRMTKPEMLHVTLAFIGEVAAENLPHIKQCAEQIAIRTPATELNFEFLGCFPSWRHPNVLWIGIVEKGFSPFDQEAPMATLGRDLAEACADFTEHKQEERVLLHVTLARAGDKMKNLQGVGKPAYEEDWKKLGKITASSVVLYESTLGKSGPVQHIPLARFPLKS